MPQVSIIVPVHNVSPYLGECVDSIIAQSVGDWELILVDDGSTDGSGEICDRYVAADARIKCIHQPNKGLSGARNAGLDAAQGEYYFFIDSDDAIHPKAIQYLLKGITCEPGVMVAAGRYHYSATKHFKESKNHGIRVVEAERLIGDILYQKPGTDNSVCWKLFDRRLFDCLRFYDGWFEDLDMFYRLYERAGRIALVDEDIYFYRRHRKSFINSWSPGRRDILRVTDRMADYIAGHMPRLMPAVAHRRFSACCNLLVADPERTGETAATIRKDIRKLRYNILRDPNSRLKNRVFGLLSLLGFNFITTLSKWVTKY